MAIDIDGLHVATQTDYMLIHVPTKRAPKKRKREESQKKRNKHGMLPKRREKRSKGKSKDFDFFYLYPNMFSLLCFSFTSQVVRLFCTKPNGAETPTIVFEALATHGDHDGITVGMNVNIFIELVSKNQLAFGKHTLNIMKIVPYLGITSNTKCFLISEGVVSSCLS